MVKADLTRDYYADLGLQPGASDSEIKKQFRQLALKYHPDRNPGREAEVNSKFQTIQSAHEVLTDAEQKAKYDSARLRSNTTRTYSGFGATTTASGTRGNPWSSAGSEWAPPPKPPPPRDAERRKPPPTSAGAARYANFATPNGTAPKATQNAEARRKNYEAWESMRPPQPPPPRAWQPPKPVPKEYTPQSGREESNSKQYAPPPKSSRPGYEEFRAGASSSHSDRTSPSRSYSTRESPRKNGFMPGTPGPDEPPAFNASAYFSRNSRPSSRRQAEAPEPPPREQPPRPAPPIDPLGQFREKDGTPFEPRLSTPYATHGGEKTNPFESINLNRSKSTREPVDNTNSTNAAPSRPSGASERHRSASPPRTRHGRNLSPEPGIARADSDIHLGSSPKRTYSSANKTYLNTESSRPQPRYTPPVEPISSDGDDSDSDKRQTSFGTRSRTFAKRRAAQTNTRPKENQVPSGGPGSSTGENDERPHGNANRGNGKEDGPSIFSFNAGDETLKSRGPTQNAFTSSAENINTTFTPEDWNGKFEAGEHFTNDGANMKGGSRARSGSRPRTRSPVKGRPISRSQPGSARPPVPHIEPEILQPATDSEQPSSSPGGTKFTPEEWARTFKPQNFAPPPFVSSTGGGRSPLRNARRSRTGSSAAKPLNATKTAMASEGDSSDSPLEIGKRTAQPTATSGTNDSVPPAGTDSPNAMDIDPPFHEQSDTPRHPPDNGFMASNDAANEARNVPVEPSRSEWRAGDASGSDIPVPLVPLKQPELPPRTGRRTTKSADEEDFRTNLEDLKNVEPLQHPATGLHSFDDLTSTLPFQSQAASRLTIPRNFSSGELDLPHPPRAPMVPITKATRPSMAQWESYLLAFKTYMAEWDIFNTKMIIHFVARKSQVDRMKLGWLEAFGDSDLEKYREGLVEDFKVRQWWDVACEKHQDAIEKFQFFKGCMREGGPPQRGPTVAN